MVTSGDNMVYTYTDTPLNPRHYSWGASNGLFRRPATLVQFLRQRSRYENYLWQRPNQDTMWEYVGVLFIHPSYLWLVPSIEVEGWYVSFMQQEQEASDPTETELLSKLTYLEQLLTNMPPDMDIERTAFEHYKEEILEELSWLHIGQDEEVQNLAMKINDAVLAMPDKETKARQLADAIYDLVYDNERNGHGQKTDAVDQIVALLIDEVKV